MRPHLYAAKGRGARPLRHRQHGSHASRRRALQRLLRLVKNDTDFDGKGGLGFSDYRRAHRIIERLTRLLWKHKDPLGAVQLADSVRSWGRSTEDPGLNVFSFTSALYARWLPLLQQRRNKSAEDHFLLGQHYLRGSKLPASLPKARLYFRLSLVKGLPNARHELAWAMAMDPTIPSDRSISEFLQASSLTRKDSLASAQLLRLVGCFSDGARTTSGFLIELKAARQQSIYSDVGGRFVNIRIEAWLKAQAALHLANPSPDAHFILGLIESLSRAKPTGCDARSWFRQASVHGHAEAMAAFARTGVDWQEWRKLAEESEANGHHVPEWVTELSREPVYPIPDADAEWDA